MRRAVRGSLVGLALALLFWLSLAPPAPREGLPSPFTPDRSSEVAATDPFPLPASELRRSALPTPPASAPVEPPASAPAPALFGRFAFDVLVIDDEARPVEGASVTAFTERTNDGKTTRVPIDPPNEWSTDSSGRCLAQALLPRRGIYVGVHLAAEKAGVGRSGSLWASIDTPAQVRLVLFSPVRVEGRVFGTDGRPAADATVHFSRENRPEGEDEGLPAAQSVDTNGRFSVEVLAGGQFHVWAESGGQRTEEVRVHSYPGSRHEILFWIPGALTIEGVLRDPPGRPVAGGKVFSWEQADTPEWRPGPGHRRQGGFASGESGTDGRFRLAAPAPGTYILVGVAQGFASSLPREVSVAESAPHSNVDLKLHETASISGVVRRETGEPLAGARLQAVLETRSGPFVHVWGRTASANVIQVPERRTADDGSFDFGPLHPVGTYAIRHFPNEPGPGREAWDHRFLQREVRGGTRGLEIVVPEGHPRTCPVTGMVLDPQGTGAPLQFSVSLYHDLGREAWGPVGHHTGRPGSGGRFSIPDRAFVGERYVLRAGGGSPGVGSAWVGPWIAQADGNEFTIRLRSSGSLACRVVDGAARPVPFAEVEVVIPAPSGWHTSMHERADESGAVRFKGVDPGMSRIRAWKGKFRSEPVEVEVLEGETRNLTIPIPR